MFESFFVRSPQLLSDFDCCPMMSAPKNLPNRWTDYPLS
jgi:hypothetical protein